MNFLHQVLPYFRTVWACFSVLSSVEDPHTLNPDRDTNPDPKFQVNLDTDLVPDPGFDDKKMKKKKIQLKNPQAFSSQKRTSST
jgi:hypothetical protein